MDLRKWLNAAAFIIMIVANVLANIIPLGGLTTGEISALYDTLFTPAPLTFSIWFAIYAGLLAFVIYQFEFWQKKKYTALVRRNLSPLFIISCLLNTLWILSWQYRYIGVSLLCISGLLISLILLVSAIPNDESGSVSQLNLSRIFELYLGWIIVAAIANLCSYLRYLGVYSFSSGSKLFTMLLLIFSAFVGIFAAKRTATNMVCVSIVWAYLGICVKHMSPNGFNGEYLLIPVVTIIAILAIVLTSIVKRNGP